METHTYRGYTIVKHEQGTARTPLGRHVWYATTEQNHSHPTLKGIKTIIDYALDTPQEERDAIRNKVIASLQKGN